MSLARSLRRLCLAGTVATALMLISFHVSSAPGQPAAGAPFSLIRDRMDPHWVRGKVTVPANPEQVWSRIREVEKWPAIFTDIKRMQVLERHGSRWKVRLETVTFDCGAHTYQIELKAPGSITLSIDAPGADANVRITIQQASSAGQALVSYDLYVRARGVMGWFVSEENLRQKQEQMAARYLADIARMFGAVPAAAR